jgi:hypothetical protein
VKQEHRLIVIAAAAAIVGFALGALWQYAGARGSLRELDETRQDLTFSQLEATLGAATIEAQRGNYEVARQLTSSFFVGLQQDVGRAPADRRAAFDEILRRRDTTITTLSRSDPQSGGMLAELFDRYRVARGETVGPYGPVPGEPPDTTSPDED